MREGSFGGGYFLDKIFILGEDEPSAFAQTLIEAKNFFDNVFIVIPEHIFAESKVRVFEVLKAKLCDGNAISLDAKTVFLMRAGERGAAEIRSEYIDLLDAKYSVKHDKMVVRTVGVPQDRLQNVLSDCKRISGEKLLYNVYQCDGEMRLELLYDSNSPKMLIDDVMRVAVQGLNDYIYAVEDTPLNERVFEILKLRGLKLGIAESFTGGGVAKKLIEVPGVSSVLFESVVAYDNLAKENVWACKNSRSCTTARFPTKRRMKWLRDFWQAEIATYPLRRRASRGRNRIIRTSLWDCVISQ